MNHKTKNIRVPYALAVYGKEEIDAVNRVLKNPTKISPGFHTKQFERKIAGVFGKNTASWSIPNKLHFVPMVGVAAQILFERASPNFLKVGREPTT